MTNAEKFKTSPERRAAYQRYVRENWDPVEEFFWLEMEAEMEAEEELLPCPFCGRKAEVKKVYGVNKYYIICSNSKELSKDNCVLTGIGARVYDSIDDAVTAWNRRAK